MNKILIGTSNQAKVNEYKKLLKDFPFEVISAIDLNIPPPEDEVGDFEQIAINKAKYYRGKSGLVTIVDDGGLEIDALGGEPGIKNRRWVGREMSDEEIINEVITRMKDIPLRERDCKHTILMAIATPYGIFVAHGHIDGIVAKEASKKRVPGFPYLSLMYIPNYDKYWIDLNEEEEYVLNHRRAALEKIKDILQVISKE